MTMISMMMMATGTMLTMRLTMRVRMVRMLMAVMMLVQPSEVWALPCG